MSRAHPARPPDSHPGPGGSRDPSSAHPAAADGSVYVADAGGRLTALDAMTGTQRWFFDPPGAQRLSTAPVVRAGAVYLMAGKALLVLDADTGRQRWSFPTGVRVSAAPAATDELVFLAAAGTGEPPTGPRLVALRVADGTLVWGCRLDGLGWDDAGRLIREVVETAGWPEFLASPPAVAGDSVYLAGPDGAVYAVAVGDGTVRWKVEAGAGRHTGCAVAGDLVFVAGDRGRLYALSTSDGSERWSAETSLQPNRVLPAVEGGLVYVAGRAVSQRPPWLTSGAVMAYEAATGERRWRRPTDTRDDGIRAAPVVHNGVVYLGLPKGSVACLDAATGTGVENRFKRWRVRSGRPIGRQPSPVVAHLQTVAWAAPVALLCTLVAVRAGWSPVAGLAAWPVLAVVAQLSAWTMFHLGVRALHRDRPVSAAVLSRLSLAAMMLVPPVRRFATHRVVAVANLASAWAQAGRPRQWRSASNLHVSMAERLAARFPSTAATALRAQANVMAAKGCQLFGDRSGAARYAAHAVDLYLAIDAFFDPDLKYEARHADAIYRELTFA